MTTQFLDERLPEHVEAGAEVGPRFQTTVTGTAGGREARNIEWSQEKLEANIAYGMMKDEDPDDRENSFREVLSFFRRCMGRAIPFRFRDPTDWTATREPIYQATDDGLYWQLARTYGADYRRRITRPVASTVKIHKADGSLLTTGWRLDVLGLVKFDSPPPGGLTASFEFDVPMRFDSDRMAVTVEHIRAGSIGDILIVQVPE